MINFFLAIGQSSYYESLMNPFGVPTVMWNQPGLGPLKITIGATIGW